jgi:LysM repeat protein
MIELRYKNNYETADIAGCTVAEVRAMYKSDFGIAVKAVAILNGKRVSAAAELSSTLNDADKLVFKAAGVNKAAFIVGALLLAIAITGGIFAYGFTNATATIKATVKEVDFASVTANTSSLPQWTARGMQKNQTGSGTLFDISTNASGYTGDFVATVSLANAGDLIKVYRTLSLSIEVRDSGNNLMDINDDGVANNSDYTLLTLENGVVKLNIKQAAANVYTVKLRNGYYKCNAKKSSWSSSLATPLLYCDISQK